jgi:hypothetical protein
MSKVKWIALMAAVLALGLSSGCGSDGDDEGDGGAGGGTPTGSYAGTWTGNVCGRGLTMVLTQNGTTLSGSYTFTDPAFNGTCSGTVSSETPPATARLNTGGHNWWFDLSFSSYNQFSGGFYKEGALTCNVNATK